MNFRERSECNQTETNIEVQIAEDYEGPPLSQFHERVEEVDDVMSIAECQDVFPELRPPIQKARSASYVAAFQLTVNQAYQKSVFKKKQRIEQIPVRSKCSKMFERAVTVIRILYFLQILYTGYAFPILIISFHFSYKYLQLLLDIFQLVYIIMKLDFAMSCCQSFKLYFSSLACLELLAIIPLEFLHEQFIQYLFLLKVTRLFNLRREFRHFYQVCIDKNVNFFWSFLLGFNCAILWMAAFWVFYCEKWPEPNWLTDYCHQNDSTYDDCYVKAIYLILQSCLTIGYGDMVPKQFNEKMLMCFYMVIGIIMFSYFIGQFSGMIEAKYLTTSEQQKALELCTQLERRLQGQKTEDLIVKIRKFIVRQNPIHLEDMENFDILDALPENFQSNISLHFNKILSEIDFFKKFPMFNVIELLPYMRELVVEKGQVVVREGDPSQEIFYVKSGKVGGVIPSCYKINIKFIFAYFKESSSFGQYQVFPICKNRKFTVISADSGCRLISIEGVGLKNYLQADETLTQQMTEYCEKKMEFLSNILRKSVDSYLLSHNLAKNTEEIDLFSSDSLPARSESGEQTKYRNPLAMKRQKTMNRIKKAKVEKIAGYLRECHKSLVEFLEEGEDFSPILFKGESAFMDPKKKY